MTDLKTIKASDAELCKDPSIIPDKAEFTSQGTALWSYRHEGRINGIPVVETDRDLLIDSDDVVNTAFRLNSKPMSKMFWLSPDTQESLKEYNELLARAADGEITITEETREFDAAHSRFIVWVHYAEISYSLHPRFEFIRKDGENA